MSEAAGEEPPRRDGRGRRLTGFAIVTAAVVLLVVMVVQDRPWVSETTRIERCIELRHAVETVRFERGELDERWSRDDVRPFCEADAANGALNHKGGVDR